MVSGRKTEPNRRISTTSTIMMPAPMAEAKPAKTSPWISASPTCWRRTPGGMVFTASDAMMRSEPSPISWPGAIDVPTLTRRSRS